MSNEYFTLHCKKNTVNFTGFSFQQFCQQIPVKITVYCKKIIQLKCLKKCIIGELLMSLIMCREEKSKGTAPTWWPVCQLGPIFFTVCCNTVKMCRNCNFFTVYCYFYGNLLAELLPGKSCKIYSILFL